MLLLLLLLLHTFAVTRAFDCMKPGATSITCSSSSKQL
jgi:hypothetical protein